jgi:hypothetical protein
LERTSASVQTFVSFCFFLFLHLLPQPPHVTATAIVQVNPAGQLCNISCGWPIQIAGNSEFIGASVVEGKCDIGVFQLNKNRR